MYFTYTQKMSQGASEVSQMEATVSSKRDNKTAPHTWESVLWHNLNETAAYSLPTIS